MKEKEKIEARRLRKEEGLPIGEIAEKLIVAKSSVSMWVRDIELTEDQKAVLLNKNPAFNKQFKAAHSAREKALEIRKSFQEEGKRLVKNANSEFIACCMLYWGEGSKNKNSVGLANTDADMLKLFVGFLRKQFGIDKTNFALKVQWYSNNGMSLDDIKSYWCSKLDLPESCFRKCQVDNISKYSQKKKGNKYPYGTCLVMVHRTDVVQKIYGAIQDIGGFERENWLW